MLLRNRNGYAIPNSQTPVQERNTPCSAKNGAAAAILLDHALQPSIPNKTRTLGFPALYLASHLLQPLAQLSNTPPLPLQPLHPIRCDYHIDRGSESLPDGQLRFIVLPLGLNPHLGDHAKIGLIARITVMVSILPRIQAPRTQLRGWGN